MEKKKERKNQNQNQANKSAMPVNNILIVTSSAIYFYDRWTNCYEKSCYMEVNKI